MITYSQNTGLEVLLVDYYTGMYTATVTKKCLCDTTYVCNLRRAVKTNVQALHWNSSSSHDIGVSEPTEQKQTLPCFINTYDKKNISSNK